MNPIDMLALTAVPIPHPLATTWAGDILYGTRATDRAMKAGLYHVDHTIATEETESHGA